MTVPLTFLNSKPIVTIRIKKLEKGLVIFGLVCFFYRQYRNEILKLTKVKRTNGIDNSKHLFILWWLLCLKKYNKTLWTLFMDGVQPSQGYKATTRKQFIFYH